MACYKEEIGRRTCTRAPLEEESSQVIGIVKAARYLSRSAHGALGRDLSDEGSVTWPQGGEDMFSALQAQSQEAPVVLGKDVTVLVAAAL